MIKRAAVCLLAIPTGVLLASCASNGSGSATPVLAADVTKLGHQMVVSVASVHSATFEMTIEAEGQKITGTGSETMSHGKLDEADVSEDLTALGQGTIRVIISHHKTYAQLPPALNSSGKPWVLVSENSTNPIIAQMASSMHDTLNNASIQTYGYFAQAASDMKKIGTESVNGVSTTHYSTDLDVSKLPSNYPNRAMMQSAGVDNIPVDMWVDAQHRPVRVETSATVQGHAVHADFTITAYNKPVTISAPPAADVATI